MSARHRNIKRFVQEWEADVAVARMHCNPGGIWWNLAHNLFCVGALAAVRELGVRQGRMEHEIAAPPFVPWSGVAP